LKVKDKKLKRIIGGISAALVVAQVVLVLMSWLLSALQIEGVRSLLSSEGVRWFCGNFASFVASPALVWLLLMAMAVGGIDHSGLLLLLRTPRLLRNYRQKLALRITVFAFMAYVAVVLALAIAPHAVLLSATGGLFPSPFSSALVPIVAFGLLLLSVLCGVAIGRYSRPSHVVGALSSGIAKAAPLFIIYILAIQFFQSLTFVFFTLF
jgi:aminobenzoyl-glutamate transport protein